MEAPSNIELFYKLADTAVTLAVMAFGLYFLVKKNTQLETKNQNLVDKMYERDMENIRSLELISKTIEKIESNGAVDTREIKEHISEQTKNIRDDIQRLR